MKKDKTIARTAAQTAILMAILTLVSKLLGFVREMVLAGFFGTSYTTDAYVMAQSIPSIIFTGVFGAVAVAYMPLFSRETEQNGIEAGSKFTNEVVNILIIASIGSILVGLVFSKQIVQIFASGFTGETAELTEYFLRIAFSYILFASIAGIIESFLQYKNIFLPQIIIGYTQNIIVIIGIVISYYLNYYFLAYGLLFGFFIRLLLLILISKKIGFYYRITLKFNSTAKKIIAMSLPIFIGSSVSQINLFVDKTLASRLIEGSVAALNYANLIITLITGLTVTILTTIIYPKLAQASAVSDQDRLNEVLSTGLNIILIVAVPFSLGAMAFHNEAVRLIYERGAFDQTATTLTSSALFYYAIGITFAAVNTVMTQTCYSRYDTKTPLLVGTIAVSVNVVLSVILIRSMHHNGLALATSVSYICNTLLLYYAMRKKYPETIVIQSKKKALSILFSSLISVGSALITYKVIINLIFTSNTIALFIGVLIAVASYLGLLTVFRVEELRILRQILKRR